MHYQHKNLGSDKDVCPTAASLILGKGNIQTVESKTLWMSSLQFLNNGFELISEALHSPGIPGLFLLHPSLEYISQLFRKISERSTYVVTSKHIVCPDSRTLPLRSCFHPYLRPALGSGPAVVDSDDHHAAEAWQRTRIEIIE